MAIDWTWLEELLVKHGEKALASFKPKKGETFYAAMFRVEPFDGVSVALLLNTKEHLAKTVDAKNRDQPHYKYMPSVFGQRVEISRTIDQWSEIDDAIVEATEADMEDDKTNPEGHWATTGKLLECVCRAAVRLEPALGKLARTDDFAIGISPDPAEPGDMSVDRYVKFKKPKKRKAPKRR